MTKLFRKNVRARVSQSLGNGAFVYEGVQATDDPAITVWKFSVYGGLASYEDEISPETRGSHLISMTAPSSAFRPAKLGGDAEKWGAKHGHAGTHYPEQKRHL